MSCAVLGAGRDQGGAGCVGVRQADKVFSRYSAQTSGGLVLFHNVVPQDGSCRARGVLLSHSRGSGVCI